MVEKQHGAVARGGSRSPAHTYRRLLTHPWHKIIAIIRVTSAAMMLAAPTSRGPARPAAWRDTWQQMMPQRQIVHLVRHGQTEMNVHLRNCSPAFGEPGFVDPNLLDTRLTADGIKQAQRLHETHTINPQVIIVSPLTRALHTAALAFPLKAYPNTPRIVHPLARERLYMSSDRGRPWHMLADEYVGHDWSLLPQEDVSAPWWGPPGDADGVETLEHLQTRVEGLRQWLERRPERCMVLVAHWAVLQALTGQDFRNCEVQEWHTDCLKARPWLLETETIACAHR